MALFGVGLDITIKRLNSDLKDYILRKQGSVSLKVLRDIFSKFDKNGNQKLEPLEFERGLAAFGFFPKKVDLQALIKAYDKNGDGSVDFEEFINGLQYVIFLIKTLLFKRSFVKKMTIFLHFLTIIKKGSL